MAIDKNGDEVRASESKKPIGSINVIENLFLIQGILAGEYEAKENKSLVEIFASACHEIFKVVGEDAVNSETKVTLVRKLFDQCALFYKIFCSHYLSFLEKNKTSPTDKKRLYRECLVSDLAPITSLMYTQYSYLTQPLEENSREKKPYYRDFMVFLMSYSTIESVTKLISYEGNLDDDAIDNFCRKKFDALGDHRYLSLREYFRGTDALEIIRFYHYIYELEEEFSKNPYLFEIKMTVLRY